MNKPTIKASRVANGVLWLVSDPTAEMRATMDTLGFALEVGLSNVYSHTSTTDENIAAVQAALRGYFGR